MFCTSSLVGHCTEDNAVFVLTGPAHQERLNHGHGHRPEDLLLHQPGHRRQPHKHTGHPGQIHQTKGNEL